MADREESVCVCVWGANTIKKKFIKFALRMQVQTN